MQNNIRVAVIGCGHWGKNLVRNFANLGALAAISEADPDVSARMSAEYGVPNLGFKRILEDSTIDAIVIAAPAELHYTLAVKGLKAGKHVYVEKPLALVTAEAEELCKLSDKVNKTLMVGHLLQYHPAFLKLKEIVHGGEVGDVQYIYSNRLSLGKIRREENTLWSFAPHDISMILSLVNEEPERVTATGAAYLHEVIADVTTTHMAFPSGVRAHIFVSWLHPFKEQKLVVIGSDGMAVFNDGLPWDEKVTMYPHRIEWEGGVPTPAKADAKPVPLDEAEPLRQECAHFLESIASGTIPRTDGNEGLRVLKVLQAAQDDLDRERAEL